MMLLFLSLLSFILYFIFFVRAFVHKIYNTWSSILHPFHVQTLVISPWLAVAVLTIGIVTGHQGRSPVPRLQNTQAPALTQESVQLGSWRTYEKEPNFANTESPPLFYTTSVGLALAANIPKQANPVQQLPLTPSLPGARQSTPSQVFFSVVTILNCFIFYPPGSL